MWCWRAFAIAALGLAGVAPVDAAGDAAMQARFAALRADAARLENGEGVARDPIRAVELYCEAAREGDADAQYSLGWMFAHGRGVVRDDALASMFFGMAAAQGHVPARNMLRIVGDRVAELPDCMRGEEAVAAYDDYIDSGFEEERIAREAAEEDAVLKGLTSEEERALRIVERWAPQYEVDPRLAMAIIRTESNFDPGAVSPKNAQGLMQLIPETAERFNVTKPFDPVQNIKGGLAYLRWLLAYFRGDVTLVAAAYNAGEGVVNKYRGVPPYAETRAYVQRIRGLFRKAWHPFNPKVADPSPELARIRANWPT